MSNVKHVFIILMENHNWTGNNSGAASGDPDIKGGSLTPYINSLIPLRAHAGGDFNPPRNHPSLPNYLWLEAGTNFGILNDGLPLRKNGKKLLNRQSTTAHLVTELVNACIRWKAYAEPNFPNPDFTDCPLNFNEVDVDYGAFLYFSDTTNGFSSSSAVCIAHVRPYSYLATDLAAVAACTPSLFTAGTACNAQYSFITPNLCHDGHESASPCAPGESTDNTLRGDTWLSNTGVPSIPNSSVYQTDGPIGMSVLSLFAKTNYHNSTHYDPPLLGKALPTQPQMI